MFGLVVIYVVECNNFYEFAYFEGSHELSYEPDKETFKDTNVAKADMKTIQQKTGGGSWQSSSFNCTRQSIQYSRVPAQEVTCNQRQYFREVCTLTDD